MTDAARRLRAGCLALALLAPAIPAGDDPPAYDAALVAYREGRPADAAALLERAIAAGRRDVGTLTLLGWSKLRLGDVDGAGRAFEEALSLEPGAADARVGRGHVALRRADAAAAERAFSEAVALAPEHAGAWGGLAAVRGRRGDVAGERAALERAVAAAPDDAGLRARLDANLRLVLEERRPRPALDPATPLRVTARARARRFEVPDGDGWRPLWVAGVNLGTALPGRFPGEFPDDERLYREWFDLMGDMGLNVVRLYTLHPPSLYRALRDHNAAAPERRLWLVQGVWTELPPDDDFDAPEFDGAFRREIRRVIDAVHGNLELPRRPGHAGGVYDADVSGDVLAWLLGREWEPFAVDVFDRRHPDATRYDGEYVAADGRLAIEAWLASVCDEAAAHQSRHYRTQAPVGFTSWPTLDPLAHPTESTLAEELAIRGVEPNPSQDARREYENDLVDVDPTVLRATPRFEAGVYAAYHAYPYYPDFMLLDPGYARARGRRGVDRYLGYLRDLARHHGEQPVLVAELGVPSSRGIAHLHPEGRHHGGHDERAMGAIDAELLEAVSDAGLAGGVLFAWIDEWFKRNWLVQLYESPPERNPLWHNALDPEQHYGLLAVLPGEGGPPVVLDGRLRDWESLQAPTLAGGGAVRRVRLAHDASYLYLAVETDPGRADGRIVVGLDTYRRDLGSRRLPGVDGLAAVGFEFAVVLDADGGDRLLVDAHYDLARNALHRPYRSVANDDGEFIAIRAWTNRERYGRDGTRYPPLGYDRSPLRRGTTDPAAPEFDSLADLFVDRSRGVHELRLPWGLLNVTDPSSHRVVHETDRVEGVVQTAATEGLVVEVVAESAAGAPVGRLAADAADAWLWPGWERPSWHARPKAGVPAIVEAVRRLTAENRDKPDSSD